MKKTIMVLILLLSLAAAGFLAYRWQAGVRSSVSGNWQLAEASLGDLTATIGATGIVRSNQTAVLTWQTTGIVEEVFVQIGDHVEKDEVLASLVETSLPQNVILARVDLINAQKSLDDLLHSEVAKIQAAQAVSNAQKALIEAERLLDKYEGANYEYKLERAEDRVEDALEELEQAKKDLAPYQNRPEEDATRQYYEDQLEIAQRNYDEAVRQLEELKLEKQQAEERVQLARAQLEDAQRQYERIKDGADPSDIAALEARIAAAQATLNLARLAAPFAGTITDVQIQAGDQVAPGKVALQIDDLSRLWVDVRISEVDINRVKVGQNTLLTFDAILGKEYQGRVSQVARVGTLSQGVVDFIVTIELLDGDENVKPGMTAAVSIVVDQLEDVLLVPNRAVRIKDGQRVVYILQGGQLAAVRITLGATSDTYSQVLNGELKPGDQIVLNPPIEFEEGGPPFVR